MYQIRGALQKQELTLRGSRFHHKVTSKLHLKFFLMFYLIF